MLDGQLSILFCICKSAKLCSPVFALREHIFEAIFPILSHMGNKKNEVLTNQNSKLADHNFEL